MLTETEKMLSELRGALTSIAQAYERLTIVAASFEQRGGVDVFGNDALEIVYLYNALQTMATPEHRATVARLRTDV